MTVANMKEERYRKLISKGENMLRRITNHIGSTLRSDRPFLYLQSGLINTMSTMICDEI